ESRMSAEIACPHCDFVMQPQTGETTPTHCPACQNRVSCPQCGLTLGPHGEPTVPWRCTHCSAEVEAASTRPFGKPAQPMKSGKAIEVAVPGYEIVGELGRGGMGVVYRAYQLSLRRHVALKVLPPLLALDVGLLARFRNEAMLAAKLVDAHILPVF